MGYTVCGVTESQTWLSNWARTHTGVNLGLDRPELVWWLCSINSSGTQAPSCSLRMSSLSLRSKMVAITFAFQITEWRKKWRRKEQRCSQTVFKKVPESRHVTLLFIFCPPEPSHKSMSICKRGWQLVTLFWIAMYWYMSKNSTTMREREDRHWEVTGNLYLTHLESCGRKEVGWCILTPFRVPGRLTKWSVLPPLYCSEEEENLKGRNRGLSLTMRGPFRMWKYNAGDLKLPEIRNPCPLL